MSAAVTKLQAALTESIWQNLQLTQENRKLVDNNAKLNRRVYELTAERDKLIAAAPARRDRT